MKDFSGRATEFKSLQAFADRIADRSELGGLAEFCRLRGRGLRPQAMQAARDFAEQARTWPLAERCKVVDELMHASLSVGAMLRPQPLVDGLILPTLREWSTTSPGEAAPHRWVGVITHNGDPLAEAVRLDPDEQIARRWLIDFVTDDVEYAVHELPCGYLGEPAADLVALDEAEGLAAGLTDPVYQEHYVAEIQALRERVRSWLARGGEAADDLEDGMLRCWMSLHAQSGMNEVAPHEGRALIARLGEPHRRYHGLEHVAECLDAFGDVEEQAGDPVAVKLAIWFHDAVYEPGAADNEARSAALADEVLERLGISEAKRRQVARLVRATDHRTPPQGNDEKLLCDIDLSILAAAPPRYDRYARAIQAEAGLPDDEFRRRRAAFLRSMLGREHIFHTEHSRATKERAARENMRRELNDREST